MTAAARKRSGARRRTAPRDAAVLRQKPVPPTPETVAKLRRDLVLHLFEKGRLCQEQLRAAEEIRRIWQAFSRGLGPTAIDLSSFAGGGRSVQARQPVEWLLPAEEAIWRRRYRPWAAEMAAQPSGGHIRAMRLRIVVDLVVENAGLRQVDGWYRMRNGTAFAHLDSGLRRYAEIAGWLPQASENYRI
jgi:hypothetical protein